MSTQQTDTSMFDAVWSRVTWCRREVLDALLELAIEIAREGREGRRIGTLFTLGRAEAVLGESRAMILDPMAGHVPERASLFDANLRGTVKELAQLDAAFVVSEERIQETELAPAAEQLAREPPFFWRRSTRRAPRRRRSRRSSHRQTCT